MTLPALETRDRDGFTREPIAIVGIGCRFPGGAHSGAEFWKLLCAGFDAIGEVPADRWSPSNFYDPDPRTPGKTAVRVGGYVQQRIQLFDAAFFGISPREAACLDPQQRLLLEVTWEAFEDAGIPPERLMGGDTGVFSGGFMQDSASIQMGYLNRDLIGQHTSVGASLTMLSARISYVFDLRGPSISVDTACSSSLVATHYACHSLWNRECSHALVAGVNMMFNPSVPIALTKAGFLSPDGRCKAFDASANGYVRSEGAGVVVLKPLSAALRDRDRVYALIRGSAVNQDGRSDGITQPNQDAQEALLREAFSRANISPRAVQYVEAHGTGTPVGDKTEAGAIAAVVGAGRDKSEPCVVGSVKTNLGHMEGAAGVGGLIKTALALKHRQIPPHLHLHRPSPNIPFEQYNLRVPRQLEPWPAAKGPLLASVNSFGYGGTNAHVVLEEAPAVVSQAREAVAEASEWLLPVSAKTPEALRAYATSLASWIRERRDFEGLTLDDLVYSAGVRRSHHEHRGALLVKSLEEAATQLETYARGDESALVASGRAAPAKGSKLVFVFTGMGPQWWRMGRELFETHPAFREAAEACDRAFQQLGAKSVLAELLAEESQSRIDDPYVAQTTNFLLQVALAEAWRALGVRPDVIIGHSAGEAAAAYCAGALTLEDAVRLCHHRSLLQASTAGSGRMLAVGLSAEEAPALIASHPNVCMAAINAPASVALSGATAELEEIARVLEGRQVFHRFIHGNVPYHSPMMAPLEARLREALSGLQPREAKIALFSSVLGAPVRGDELNADYWWRNVRDPVHFEAALGQILEKSGEAHLFVEVGPHPVLAAAIGACLKHRQRSGTVVPSLHREKRERTTLLSSIGRLFVAGGRVDFSQHASASARFIPLPFYPWQREHHWHEAAASIQDRLGTPGHPLLRRRVPSATPTWEAELCAGLLPYLPDHRVQGQVVFPGAAYVDAAMAMHKVVSGSSDFTLERLEVRNALVIPPAQSTVLRLTLEPETGTFNIHSYQRGDDRSWQLHATGRMLQRSIAPQRARFDLPALQAACKTHLDVTSVYAALERSGFQYGPWFQGIQEISCSPGGEALARIRLRPQPDEHAEHYLIHPAVLDAAFQTLVSTISEGGQSADPSATYLPVGITETRLTRPAPEQVWAYGRFSIQTESEVGADLWLIDDTGEVVAEVRGVRARALPKMTRQVAVTDDWFYQLHWERQPLVTPEQPQAGTEPERWLIFSDGSPLARKLDAALTETGRLTTLVTLGESEARPGERHFQVRPQEPADLQRMVAGLAADKQTLRAAYLWSMEPPQASQPLSITGIDGCGRLLPVIQALAGASTSGSHQLWVLTQGAQRVSDERLEHAAPTPLWAMARMSNVEHRQLRCACVDLDPSQPDASGQLPTVLRELLHGGEENEVALRGDARYVVRLERVGKTSPARQERASLDQVSVALKPPAQRGSIAGVSFERASRASPGLGQVELEVRAAGLNFKDIAKLRGVLTDADLEGSFTGRRLGMDCAGVVTAVGQGVTGLSVGDEVIAFAPGCIASHVLARAIDVWRKPAELSFEEATGLGPFVYAIHSLTHVARLRAKETVLIHSAAGGTGLAAVQWAKHLGAEVLATAGTEEKRAYLKALGVARVMDSRSLSFADEVLEHTGGRGVDVVLNTMTGEGLRRSLSVLAPHGRFVDLTYFGNQRFELTPNTFPRNVSLLGVDLDSLFVHRPEETTGLMREVASFYAQGAIRPLPVTVFPPSQMAEAFGHLAERRNIGRATVSMRAGDVRIPPRSSPGLRPDVTYLITGGLGGFGIATAQWLVDNGARHLALAGRSGISSDDARKGVAELEQRGAVVKIIQADVSLEQDVARMLEEVRQSLPPLRGVFHAAAAFGGEFLVESSAELLTAAMSPKVLGAWYLHQLTRSLPLDYFVLFSSVAGTLGETGTAAYSAANNFLDGLSHVRQSQGLPSIAIGWGLLGDVGIGARDARIGALVQSVGHRPMPVKELLTVLGEALVTQPAHLFITDTDWGRWALTHPLMKALPRLSQVLPKASEVGSEGGQNFTEALRGADAATRERLVRALLVDQLAVVLRMSPDRIDADTPLGDLGMDSLMASELSVRLEKATGMMIPMMMLMRRSSLKDVVQRLLEMIADPAAAATVAGAPAAVIIKPTQHTFVSEDGLTVYGHLSLPPGAGPHPAVVVHTSGLGGALNTAGQYVNLVEHGPLLARGYAVFTVDQRGAPGHGEKYARMADMGGGEVSDLAAAARYLGTLSTIDKKRLGVMGTSRGAYAALLAACRSPELWKAAVLAMGFYEPVTFVQTERRERPDTSPLREHASRRWEDLERYFSDEPRQPLQQLRQVRAPLMVIHGDADAFVGVDQARLLQRAAQTAGVPAELEVIPGMDHDVEQRHAAWPRLWGQMGDFLDRHVAGKAPEPKGELVAQPQAKVS